MTSLKFDDPSKIEDIPDLPITLFNTPSLSFNLIIKSNFEKIKFPNLNLSVYDFRNIKYIPMSNSTFTLYFPDEILDWFPQSILFQDNKNPDKKIVLKCTLDSSIKKYNNELIQLAPLSDLNIKTIDISHIQKYYKCDSKQINYRIFNITTELITPVTKNTAKTILIKRSEDQEIMKMNHNYKRDKTSKIDYSIILKLHTKGINKVSLTDTIQNNLANTVLGITLFEIVVL